MGCKEWIRYRRALVIPRHDDRDTRVGDALEWLEGAEDQLSGDLTPEEDVASVNDEVDVGGEGGLQCSIEVSKEILASATTTDARTLRQIKPEVGVGKEKDSDRSMCHAH